MLAAGALTIVATGSIPVAAISDIGTTDRAPLRRADRARGGCASSGGRRPIRRRPIRREHGDTQGGGATNGSATAEAPTGPDTRRQFDEAIGIAVDGSTVAVVAPPLPPSDDDVAIGTADDGSTVAVRVPPTASERRSFGVDDEGFDVGVGSALPPPVEPAG